MGNVPRVLYFLCSLREAGTSVMETVSVLRMNQQHATQLMTHLTAYRSYLWQTMLPTPERNQLIRSIQALQGRLELLQVQRQEQVTMALSKEGRSTLKHVLGELMKLYGTIAAPARPNPTLSEVAGLHLLVERTFRHMQTL
jgi:hypothetical protein